MTENISGIFFVSFDFHFGSHPNRLLRQGGV